MSIIIFYVTICIAVANGWKYYFGLKNLREAQMYSTSSLDWPSTTGRILTSKFTKETTNNSQWLSGTDGNGNPTTFEVWGDVSYVYRFKIEYIYTVDGVSYDGLIDDIAPVYNEDDARNVVRRYSVGSPINIYYDPQHPSYAVLYRSDGTPWDIVEELDRNSLIVKVCIAIIVLIFIYRLFT